MLAPYRWIRDYADVEDDPQILADKMIMTGNGVEDIVYYGEDIVNVVVGKIEKIEKHPNADKLQICSIDVGESEPIQIVTGADNIFEGAYIPVAKAPAVLPAGPIKKGKLRGVASNGMLCSGEELNLKEEDYPGAGVYGILILQGTPEIGADIREVLKLSGAAIDFEVGANRPDCLSMIGTAREASAAEKCGFQLPEIDYRENPGFRTDQMVSVDVKDTDLCPRYIAAGVKNIKIQPSPEWMRIRLKEAGIRPINNIVDITNFVMLETGQPMHAFDASKIRGDKIIVRRAEDGETMQTLDGKEHTFTDRMLLICDQDGPIGVAGVMGGLDSEITDQTTEVIFEAAKFMYGNIRQTSRGLGISTESSMRFSKGVDAATTLFAMQRALTLIDQLGAGEIAEGMIDVLHDEVKQRIIKTSASKINARLGTDLSAKEMQQLLNRVFIQTGVIGDELVCTIPTFRSDIAGTADISEEVARIYGYDNIPRTDAQIEMRRGVIPKDEIKTDIIKDYLRDAGFLECTTFSFAGEQDYTKLGLPMPDSVKILNPLGDDTSLMRTTLIPQMLNTVALNQNRKNGDLSLFEIARGFYPKDGQTLPDEVPLAVFAEYGSDFYSLKGILENIVMLLCKKELRCEKAEVPYLHPGISARVYADGKEIGVMGGVHPAVMKAFDITKDTIIAQINLDALFAIPKPEIKYKALSKHPAAVRDLAVIADMDVGAGDMLDAMLRAGGKKIESIELFDVFTGSQVDSGKKSVAYTITMRKQDATLTDAEVDAVIEKLLKVLEEEFGAKLR